MNAQSKYTYGNIFLEGHNLLITARSSDDAPDNEITVDLRYVMSILIKNSVLWFAYTHYVQEVDLGLDPEVSDDLSTAVINAFRRYKQPDAYPDTPYDVAALGEVEMFGDQPVSPYPYDYDHNGREQMVSQPSAMMVGDSITDSDKAGLSLASVVQPVSYQGRKEYMINMDATAEEKNEHEQGNNKQDAILLQLYSYPNGCDYLIPSELSTNRRLHTWLIKIADIQSFSHLYGKFHVVCKDRIYTTMTLQFQPAPELVEYIKNILSKSPLINQE